jgi:hypothetical protein
MIDLLSGIAVASILPGVDDDVALIRIFLIATGNDDRF